MSQFANGVAGSAHRCGRQGWYDRQERPRYVALFAAIVLSALGCGESGPTIIPVSGTVTFDGGPCPTNGTITFSPIETPEGVPRRPGSGKFDKDGNYEITSFQPGDGLFLGNYRVRIECVSGLPPQRPNGFEEVSYIAPSYKPEELNVSADGGEIEANFDVPLKK